MLDQAVKEKKVVLEQLGKAMSNNESLSSKLVERDDEINKLRQSLRGAREALGKAQNVRNLNT